MPYYFLIIFLLVLFIFILVILKFRHPSKEEKILLSVRFPKEKEGGNFKQEIEIFERFLNYLNRLKKTIVLETSVHHLGEEINFYISADRETVDSISQYINKFWPTAQLDFANDYDVFNPQGYNEGAYLKLTRRPAFTLRTYRQMEFDAFTAVLGVLSKLEEIGEGAAIQLVIHPASAKVYRQIGYKKKTNKPLFEVNLRLVASAASQFRVKNIFKDLSESFSQFATIFENEIKLVKPRDIKNFHFRFCFREFEPIEKIVLNIEELASLFHFPTSSMLIPRIKWLHSKEAPAPSEISGPSAGRGVLIGKNNFRGKTVPVYFDYPDRACHLEIIGQAGTGKSTLMINLAVQDIRQGKGAAIIDPEGDITDGVAGLIPKERFADVIYLDPTDLWHPFGLNILDFDYSQLAEKEFIFNEILSIFKKIFPVETESPLFEKYLKNGLRLLFENTGKERFTLIDLRKIFIDESFRRKKIQSANNSELIEFWKNEDEFKKIAPSLVSVFNYLIANDYLRPIIGQRQSAFDFRRALNEGKIILLNLEKQHLGENSANLLGMIFMAKLFLAGLPQTNQSVSRRTTEQRPYCLFIDEFYNYLTDSLAVYLKNISQSGICLNVVHRSTKEISGDLLNLINSFGSIIVFRLGLDDAEAIIDRFAPVFSVNDLINLDNFYACTCLLVKNKLSQPFSFRILLPERKNAVLLKKIKEASRAIYTRNRQKVEMEIYKRMK